jgi:N6-L-threonylcarbamoyladenine synthase
MMILGIETSCDETSVAVVKDGTQVLSVVISSSQAMFAKLAGVIPEEAARRQVECMQPVLTEALKQANASMDDMDAIAVTKGPGLLGSLLIGTTCARVLASIHKKPLIGVHHTLGHLSSTWLEAEDEPLFPIITLSASGGHTDLWHRTSHIKGKLIGRTRDDAAGEAFDKGASMLGLPYPGGPAIGRISSEGNHTAFAFPLPLSQEHTLDFSFSGLKTSLRYLLRDHEWLDASTIPEATKKDIAASFQHAICRHLVDRIKKSLEQYPEAQEIHVVGGVSANTYLRTLLKDFCASSGVVFRAPKKGIYCTDNAAMIASAGFFCAEESAHNAYATFTTAASLPLEDTVLSS